MAPSYKMSSFVFTKEISIYAFCTFLAKSAAQLFICPSEWLKPHCVNALAIGRIQVFQFI